MYNRTVIRYSVLIRTIIVLLGAAPVYVQPASLASDPQVPATWPVVQEVLIEGNTAVSAATILAKVPFRVGYPFDSNVTSTCIKLLYSLGFFSQIRICTQDHPQGGVSVIIEVTEKPRLSNWELIGTSHVSAEDVDKKLAISDLSMADQVDIDVLAQSITTMLKDKQFLHAQVTGALTPNDDGTATATFTVQEGARTRVRRVFFQGNHCIPEDALRGIIFTREDWILSFMDRAGTFIQDALEYDKYLIEEYYQNKGFLTAHVVDVQVEQYPEPGTHDVQITFVINEGSLYRIDEVTAGGNDEISDEILQRVITIRPGDLYSREKVRQSMENIRLLWGEKGYIYAQVEPRFSLPDEQQKTISLDFTSTLGSKVRVNRIAIQGNKKTYDRVIRRQIRFNEGELLTTSKLDLSKAALEATGFFDPRGGVNWKISRLDDTHADATLLLKEKPTGRANFQLGFGGAGQNITSPASGFSLGGTIQDINAGGHGFSYAFSANIAKQDQSFNFDIMTPWIADRPIGLGGNLSLRSMAYEDFRQTTMRPSERYFGGSGIVRFVIPQIGYVMFQTEAGAQRLVYNNPRAMTVGPQALVQNIIFDNILNKIFHDGVLVWASTVFGQDARNNPYQPTHGYLWNVTTMFGIPAPGCPVFSFAKLQMDGQYYIPLISEYNVVLKLKAFLGAMYVPVTKSVPYKELFHIGGPATVRGFEFGEIGPRMFGNSVGGSNALVVNAEIQFPISPDQGMRGVLFYDGGSGWNFPYSSESGPFLTNNNFDFRHAIGFGIRLTQPTPLRIDVGFRLDRRKRAGEPASRVHFGMNQEF